MTIEYSVIIPAYNEEEFLPGSLDSIIKAMKGIDIPGEIIVVDNNSKDKTAEIARQYGAEVVFEPINQISRARNRGARSANGRYLIFIDADSFISADILKSALENLASGTCYGGGGLMKLDRDSGFVASKMVALWNWLSVKRNVAAGSFLYCLKDGYEAVGGFSEKVYAKEEEFFSRELGKWGKEKGLSFRIITSSPVITSNRKLKDFSLFHRLLQAAILIFPFAIFSKSLCFFWYKRPEKRT